MSASPQHAPVGKEAFLRWVLIIAPVIAVVLLQLKYTVPVPCMDQWDLVAELEKMHDGRLTISDLWEQHNEHRIFFPRLVMLSLARVTGWDIRYEIALNSILALVVFALLISLIRRTSQKLNVDLAWAIPVVSLLLFSFNHYQNWLWGWQIQIWLSLLAVVLAIRLLAEEFHWLRFGGALGAAMIATYSFANGAAIWFIGLPFLMVNANGKKRTAAMLLWLSAAALTFWTYFHQYQRRANASTPSQVFEEPFGYAHYVLNFLGSLFAQYPPTDLDRLFGLMFGLGGLLGIVWLGIRLTRNRENLVAVLPFLGLSAYALCGAAITGFGRMHMGADQAFTSRYCTIAAPLWIAIVVLLQIWCSTLKKVQPHSARITLRWAAVGAGVVVSVAIVNSARATIQARDMSELEAIGMGALLKLSDPAAEPDMARLGILFPKPEVVVELAAVLQKRHLSVFKNQTKETQR